MHRFDKNSVGYTQTGGRFDVYAINNTWALVVDTKDNTTSDWMPKKEAQSQVNYLNSGAVYEI